jgi:hypothetical protein
MKKLLLTGIAVLFLATGAAHAHDAQLPDGMFGTWCEMHDAALDRALPNNEFYSKCENGNLFIFDKGYKYAAGGSCEFTSIKFDRSGVHPNGDAYDVFVVRANCKGRVDVNGNPYLYSDFFEIAISDGQLSRRFLPKDGKSRKSVMFMRSVPDSQWATDCRHGWISKAFAKIDEDDPPIEVLDRTVRISYNELRKLVKELPSILRGVKACDAYRKCLDERDAGKIKHCYANDRRWREFFTGGW